MSPWVQGAGALALALALLLGRWALVRSLIGRIRREISGRRLGKGRVLLVEDRVWSRLAAVMRRLDPTLAAEIAHYYHLARTAKLAIEEPVPLRLASRPGEVAHFMRARHRLLARLTREAEGRDGFRQRKRAHREGGDGSLPVGRGDVGLSGRGGH